jgi:hypothetical protein
MFLRRSIQNVLKYKNTIQFEYYAKHLIYIFFIDYLYIMYNNIYIILIYLMSIIIMFLI